MIVTDQPAYDKIRDWLSSRCGITFPEHKSAVLRQRLARVNQSFSYKDLNDLAHGLLEEQKEDVQLAVMHAASTNHTYFFREPEVLDRFRKIVMPYLQKKREMRIWSAAASSGDEAYTVAVMIAEEFGEEALSRLNILGTDISGPVVEQAEQGVYQLKQLDKTERRLVQKYFTALNPNTFAVKDLLKSCCTFRRMNLKAQPYPFINPFQVVFCRNILYYFDRDDQRSTLEAIYEVTEPGGYLITSVTESIRDLDTRWEPVATGIHRRAE